jgi:hypothetical protein
MDMSTSEKFYVQTTFRVLGTIGGVALGMAFAYIEAQISSGYNTGFRPNEVHDEDWKLIIFRTSVIVPVIFLCTLFMKLFPKYTYPFVVFAVQTPAGMFAANIKEGVGQALSAICAVVVAVISIILFENFSTESLLMQTNNRAIQGVLAITQMALRGDGAMASVFAENTETVHKNINTAESSISTYAQWRRMTCRSVRLDYTILARPIKPLFYQAYSVYWSNVESYKASDYNSRYLFCDSPEFFDKYFRDLVDGIDVAVDGIREELSKFFSTLYHQDEHVLAMLDRIISQ